MGCILDGADDDARHQSRPVAAAPSSSSMSPSLSLHHRRLARSAALNCLLLRDSRLVVVVPCWTRKKVLGVSPKSNKSSVDNVCRRNDVLDENEGATGLLSSPFGRVVYGGDDEMAVKSTAVTHLPPCPLTGNHHPIQRYHTHSPLHPITLFLSIPTHHPLNIIPTTLILPKKTKPYDDTSRR